MGSEFLGVETEVGNYYINLVENHEQEINLQDNDVLEWADAVVLESGEAEYESMELGDLIRDKHYRGVFNLSDSESLQQYENLDELADIYLVDMPSKRKDLSEEEINLGIRLPAASGVLLSAAVGNPLPLLGGLPLLSLHANRTSAYPNLSLSNFYNTIGMRSATAAEKLEESIAPELSKQVDDKPEILVSYGAAHADIAAYLEKPKLRKKVLDIHNLLNYSYKDEFYSDKICKISLGKGGEMDWIEQISYELEFYEA